MKTVFGLGVAWLFGIALVLLLCIVGAGFTIWYNYHIAVPVENSERHVITCSQQYLVTQKSRISDDLSGIAADNLAIAQTHTGDAKQDSRIVASLQSQQHTNADDIYNALDASQCSRSQIIQDMPELSSFFQEYPTR